MKKIFLTMAVMALFAIGFAASDDDSSSSSSYQQEQKKETDEERKAREKKEKLESVKSYGYKCGKDEADKTFPIEAKKWYIGRWGIPETDEDLRLFKIFEEEYYRGLNEGRAAIEKMNNM